MRILASILWQRLDLEGHDACLLGETDDSRTLKGHALFAHDAGPCGLAYEVDCDLSWRTRRARVDGFCGMREMHYQIERLADGQWLLNGASQAEVAGLVDVDLGFTPATNLLAIRRLELGDGWRRRRRPLIWPFLNSGSRVSNRPTGGSTTAAMLMPHPCTATMLS